MNILDAVKDKAAKKMTEARQPSVSAAPPPSHRPPPAGETLKGFNSDVLNKAMMFSKDKDDQHHKDKDGDDDSDSGWSEDEKKTQTQAQQSHSGPKEKGTVLAAGEKLPSGAVVKKSISKPPDVSRPPPTRPASTIIHNVGEAVATLTSETAIVGSSNQSTGGSDDPSPKPNPTFTATIPEKKDGNESIHSQMDVDLPFPPPPGKSFQLKSSQPFSATSSNTNSEHDDEADVELMREDGGADLTLTEKVFELRSRSRTESKASDSEIRLKAEESDRANLTSSQAGGIKSLRTTISASSATHIQVDSSANKFSAALFEEEIADLKKSLRRAESRLNESDKVAGNMKRELEIEKELEDAYRKAYKLKMEKQALEISVQELQSRLTKLESNMGQAVATPEFNNNKKKSSSSYLPGDPNSMEIAIEKGERERRLETM
eukprot:gene28262-37290_t